MPEIGKRFLQVPGPCSGQFAGEQGVEFLPGSPAYPTTAAKKRPAHMLEPLCGFAAFRPQACTLGAADLIHRLIQVARDMKTVKHMQGLTHLGRDNLQVGLPHVTAHKPQPFDDLGAQCL